eukprot:6207744-Pleurochrysis_carterae.AAC.1
MFPIVIPVTSCRPTKDRVINRYSRAQLPACCCDRTPQQHLKGASHCECSRSIETPPTTRDTDLPTFGYPEPVPERAATSNQPVMGPIAK